MRTIALTSVNRFTFALALLALGISAPAQAETINCTAIMSLPAAISTQGIHCLKRAPALVMRDRTSKSLSRTRSRRNFPGSRFARPGLGRPAVEPRALPARAKRSPTMALRRDGLAASPARPRLPRTTRPRFALPGAQRMGNLATARSIGAAITISANNVTLDLNGFKLGGQAAGTGTNAIGIFSTANNVTVKNGIVRGFLVGIDLRGRGAVVKDLLVDQNTITGIFVSGQGAVVRRNQVVDTGGSTSGAGAEARGIRADGSGSLIERNVVAGLLTATGANSEIGILVLNAANSTVNNNVVSDTARPSGGGASFGILIINSTGIGVLRNAVTNFDNGVLYQSLSTGTFARNTVINSTIPFSGGTQGSGNN